tara:strand:+ start:396 stop:521 length:126 start_codon:yes stop_codon:yes gene_type:complete
MGYCRKGGLGLAALISHREPRKVAGIRAILGAQPAEKDADF